MQRRRRPRTDGVPKGRPTGKQNPANWSIETIPSSLLLKKTLGGALDGGHWRRKVATARTTRLVVVLLQNVIRQSGAELFPEERELQDVLPVEDELAATSSHPALIALGRDALDFYAYILRGKSDNERCQRFLEQRTLTPMFMFNFLVRPSAQITKATILHELIGACRTNYTSPRSPNGKHDGDEEHLKTEKALRQSHANFTVTMRLLVQHCLRLEPRLVINLAEEASQYIRSVADHEGEEKRLFVMQCESLNESLKLFRPQPGLQAVQRALPNAYLWAAQSTLLSMSASLKKPLLVDHGGFRAIRDVLAGQPKNAVEVHSSTRHAPSWPPYLQPGDGMDERTDPEDNWSRAVSAGMLMQEAGFAMTDRDHAVDVLQGMSLDGTPTIQQRSALGRGRSVSIWEASIKATRNAQEAWVRFKTPPDSSLRAGPGEYAAMLTKLIMREADSNSGLQPGDKALSFPTQSEANLAEFEIARLRPPSVAELYQQMRLGGIVPEGSCLRILMANASSLETLHEYLRDSPLDDRLVRALESDDPDRSLVVKVPPSIVSVYAGALLHVDGKRRGNVLMRAIRLTELRFGNENSRWGAHTWGVILKGLAQHHKKLRLSLAEQLETIFHVVELITSSQGTRVSMFTQLNKCVRKIAARELQAVVDLEGSSEIPMWEAQQASGHDDDGGHSMPNHDNNHISSGHLLLKNATIRMKTMFYALVQQELDLQHLLGQPNIPPLERMDSRRDAVRADHAYEYMLALAYMGEFDEMARTLQWLIGEWSGPDVVSALNELDEPPAYADFSDTLCLFRLVAEPMLPSDSVISLQRATESLRLEWTWPGDQTVQAYADMHADAPMNALRRAVERSVGGSVPAE